MNNSIIQIKNLTKSFFIGKQEVLVLNNISLSIKTADFCIIFGPSGCGKSTLLHTILGLEEPSIGSCTFLGWNLYKGITEDQRSDFRKIHVGMVYQQSNWIKSLTVLENVAFPLLLTGRSRIESLQKAGEMLDVVAMRNWAAYTPSELSGGQQQKVALARAMVTHPDVIIADEPTGNMDFESGQELMRILVKLNLEQRKTILMVTHDLDILKYARTVVRMFNGEVMQEYEGRAKDQLLENIKWQRQS